MLLERAVVDAGHDGVDGEVALVIAADRVLDPLILSTLLRRGKPAVAVLDGAFAGAWPAGTNP